MTDTRLIFGKYVIGKASQQGDARRLYEDRLKVATLQTAGNLNLIVGAVADGVGSADGSIAAEMAIDTAFKSIQTCRETSIPDVIDIAMQEANRAVYESNQEHERSTYTTLVLAIIANDRLYVGNVGDSRAYWMPRSEQLLQLTLDHSYYNIYGGSPDSEEAGLVVNIIGKKPEVDVDLGFYLKGKDPQAAYKLGAAGLPLQPGDSVMLCSDGLYKDDPNGQPYTKPEEMVEAVQSEFQPDAAAVRMASHAVGRRVDDNVSVVTFQYLSPELIRQLEERTEKARRVRLIKRIGIIMGVVALIAVALVLGIQWRNSAQALAAEQGKPTSTPVIMVTKIEVPTPTATATLKPGTARLNQIAGNGQIMVETGGKSIELKLMDELQSGSVIKPRNAGVQLLVAESAQTVSEVFLPSSSELKLNFGQILTPELYTGWVYVHPVGGRAEVSLPNNGGALANVEDGGRMVVEIKDQNVTVYCFEGTCRLEDKDGNGRKVQAGFMQVYHTADNKFDEKSAEMEYNQKWQWNLDCNSCLLQVVSTPTPTPAGYIQPPTNTPAPPTKVIPPTATVGSVQYDPPTITPKPNAPPKKNPD